jgi:hypothetical protein
MSNLSFTTGIPGQYVIMFKECGKENCIDWSEIPPIIIDFDDDECSDEES